jgi:integrase
MEWLEHRRATVKESTYSKYENDLRLHILPALGKLYLDSIRPRDVKAFVAEQSKTCAGWSVANRLRLLRTISKDALADDLTDLDFCARVRLPKVDGYTEEEPNLLTAAQLDQVAQAIPPAWYPLFATMAFTGMRWGEVSGLQWSDIDRENGVIRIQRNNWKGVITTPKTRKSARTVPMAGSLAIILATHRERMEIAEHPGLATGWIFPNTKGGLHKGTPLGPVLHRAMTRAGLTMRLTPHGLRRTFNDLARRVASSMVVKAITGQVTDAMHEHYSLVDAGEKQAVQTAIVDMVERGREGENPLHGEDCGEHRLPGGPREPVKPQ